MANTDKWEREFADLRGKHASELKDTEANRQPRRAARPEAAAAGRRVRSRLRELEDREARLHDGILAKEREQLLFQRQFIAQQEAQFEESHLERCIGLRSVLEAKYRDVLINAFKDDISID